MKLFSFFSILGALILSCDASHYLLEKRATRVSIISYALTNNVLSGSIMIQNIAFAKIVTIIYAVGSTWSDNQKLTATYSSGPGTNGYETWTFSGTATGATQFYIKYDVNGASYYDPENNINHQISTPPPTTIIPGSRCTVTVTTTISLGLMPSMKDITKIY